MDVVGTLSGVYGADGLGFEDKEASKSVSEFKYAVYSGNLWSECVELEEELLMASEYVYQFWNLCVKVVCFNL